MKTRPGFRLRQPRLAGVARHRQTTLARAEVEESARRVDEQSMAYEVDREPGAWVARTATRHSRAVWVAVVLLFLVAAGGFALALSPEKSMVGGLAVLALVGALKIVGERRLDLALRFRLGARAERSVGETLNELRREGYVVMHDVEQTGEGNIDHFVAGRTGAFLIETKARGYLESHLVKARRQAAKLHDELGTWHARHLHRRARGRAVPR